MPPSAEFIKVISDFVRDVETTFPEYTRLLRKWSTDHERLHAFCVKKYTPRASDFFSKNERIFDEDAEVDTEFLPHIHFKNLWQYEDLTEGTKDAIWSYLQLISLSLGVTEPTETDSSSSSSSASPSSEEMDEMVQHALEHMSQIWNRESTPESSDTAAEPSVEPAPSTSGASASAGASQGDMFEGLFTGKLASLAKELAEETAGTLSFAEDATLEDATKQLFSNPANLSSVMKSVSEKLDARMKNGELSQEELMTEAMSMMGKMSSIPGLGNLFNNIANMGKPGGSGGGASSSGYSQLSKQEKIKARLRNKVNNKNPK